VPTGLSAALRDGGAMRADAFMIPAGRRTVVNHALLMWTSLAVFGTLAGGRAVLTVRAAPGLPLSDLFAAMAALVVVGGSLVALRDPDRFEPSPPWIAYVAAAGTLVYVASLVV
jgi:hypothetical protein